MARKLCLFILLLLAFCWGFWGGAWIDSQREKARTHKAVKTKPREASLPKVTLVSYQELSTARASQLEGLLREYLNQDWLMTKATTDRAYDRAAIRAYATLRAMRQTHAEMSRSEIDKFYQESKILPSPVSHRKRLMIAGLSIRRSYVRKDFCYFLTIAGIGADCLSSSPLYESGAAAKIEAQQKKKLRRILAE